MGVIGLDFMFELVDSNLGLLAGRGSMRLPSALDKFYIFFWASEGAGLVCTGLVLFYVEWVCSWSDNDSLFLVSFCSLLRFYLASSSSFFLNISSYLLIFSASRSTDN
jgi:hypothetical protein